MVLELFEYIPSWYQQMQISILELIYIHSELHVSANHVTIFGEIKYEI